ncbi:glycosyltransferase [Bacillus lacus]|uniref:Glycosyltransferase n=2 Tax=Metabacillus lacus TaxID=1983721 RepID=A0A7X2M0N4_9BACI|nr:glycosyltransferase [Metabacillus lacus]
MELPRISIVIPFYNCEYVGRAISSALNQTYPNIEVIVVNDGATLHTEKINPYRDRISYLKKENGGTASAVNLGLQHAGGDYFCWLSSDDEYELNKTEVQLRTMQLLNARMSYTNFNIIDENSVLQKAMAGPASSSPKDFYSGMLTGCPINGCTVMIQSSLFEEAGSFNETLRYTQDYEMWLRLLQIEEFHYIPYPLVKHRSHQRMGSVRYQRELWDEFAGVRDKYRDYLEGKIRTS